MKRNLIFDGNYIVFKLFYSKTPTVQGFFQLLLSEAIRHDSGHLCVAWDSPNNFRKQINSNYKANRVFDKKTDEQKSEILQIYADINTLKESFEKCGINQTEYKSFEGDDVMLGVIVLYPEVKHIMYANDQDLYAYLAPNVIMYDGKHVMSLRKFRETYGIEPWQWDRVKQIAGCKSDNILGVKGVGNKTAVKFLRGLLPKTHKAYRAIINNRELVNSNSVLVKAKIPKNFQCEIVNNISISRLQEVFNDLGLDLCATEWSILNENHG